MLLSQDQKSSGPGVVWLFLLEVDIGFAGVG